MLPDPDRFDSQSGIDCRFHNTLARVTDARTPASVTRAIFSPAFKS